MNRCLGLSCYKKTHLENVIGTAAIYDTVLGRIQRERKQKMVTNASPFPDLIKE